VLLFSNLSVSDINISPLRPARWQAGIENVEVKYLKK
jgi:hypothetical protein